MKNFFERLFGVDKVDEIINKNAEQPTVKKDLTPKEIATNNKEPWITVLNTHVNKDNIRNGFFELDWNEYFVLELKKEGYQGESEEEIVNHWFRELCKNIGSEEEIEMERRNTGYINVNNLGNGRTEFS